MQKKSSRPFDYGGFLKETISILFVDDVAEIRHLYVMVLENLFSEMTIEVVEASSGNMAIEILEQRPNFDLIICDYNMDQGNGGDVYLYTQKKTPLTPFFLFTSELIAHLPEFKTFEKDNPKNRYFQKPVTIDEIGDQIKSLIVDGACRPSSRNEYKKIRTIFFLRFDQTLCDVFIKLSDMKIVKILSSGAPFTPKDISKYVKKGIDYLYVRTSDFDEFKVGVSETPFLMRVSNEGAKEDAEKEWDGIREVVHHLVGEYGIDKTTMKLAEKFVGKIIDDVRKTDFFDELRFIQNKTGDRMYEHSYMASVMSCAILKGLDIAFEHNMLSLCTVAIFHDITLTSSEVCMVDDVTDSKFLELDFETKSNFLNHPQDVANKLSNASVLQQDVKTIVAQHHERPDGKGFPNRLNGKSLHFLSSIFIVAHMFVTEMYKSSFSSEKRDDIIELIYSKYDDEKFQEATLALAKSMKTDLWP